MNYKAIYDTTKRPSFPWFIERQDGKRMDYGVVAKMLIDREELLAALIELEKVESSPHSETVRFLAREQAREAIARATGAA